MQIFLGSGLSCCLQMSDYFISVHGEDAFLCQLKMSTVMAFLKPRKEGFRAHEGLALLSRKYVVYMMPLFGGP